MRFPCASPTVSFCARLESFLSMPTSATVGRTSVPLWNRARIASPPVASPTVSFCSRCSAEEKGACSINAPLVVGLAVGAERSAHGAAPRASALHEAASHALRAQKGVRPETCTGRARLVLGRRLYRASSHLEIRTGPVQPLNTGPEGCAGDGDAHGFGQLSRPLVRWVAGSDELSRTGNSVRQSRLGRASRARATLA